VPREANGTGIPPKYARAVGAAVEFRDVTKIYPGARETRALDGLSLRVEPGELVAVVGPSGCGKSTLLHLAGGIDRPSRGAVAVDGQDLSRLSETEITLYRRRRVGTVFQFFNLIPALTVMENVRLPLSLDEGRGGAERARELLERVGLPEKAEAFPYELSGGQMQRVAVARALCARPPLLLADEPTGNLDSASGEAVLELLAGLARESGVTVILATHSLEAARRADRVARLRDGRLA
jgi:putative ABC transport system ATP-binding protein